MKLFTFKVKLKCHLLMAALNKLMNGRPLKNDRIIKSIKFIGRILFSLGWHWFTAAACTGQNDLILYFKFFWSSNMKSDKLWKVGKEFPTVNLCKTLKLIRWIKVHLRLEWVPSAALHSSLSMLFSLNSVSICFWDLSCSVFICWFPQRLKLRPSTLDSGNRRLFLCPELHLSAPSAPLDSWPAIEGPAEETKIFF